MTVARTAYSNLYIVATKVNRLLSLINAQPSSFAKKDETLLQKNRPLNRIFFVSLMIYVDQR